MNGMKEPDKLTDRIMELVEHAQILEAIKQSDIVLTEENLDDLLLILHEFPIVREPWTFKKLNQMLTK